MRKGTCLLNLVNAVSFFEEFLNFKFYVLFFIFYVESQFSFYQIKGRKESSIKSCIMESIEKHCLAYKKLFDILRGGG